MKVRDSIVSEGASARKKPKHRHPWVYLYKVKSGRRKTGNVEKMHYNRTDLMGHAVEKYSRKKENFYVYSVVRVMRMHMKSRGEDI